jgi:hypothetical protein
MNSHGSGTAPDEPSGPDEADRIDQQLRATLPADVPSRECWARLEKSVTGKSTGRQPKRFQERFGILNAAALIGIVIISAAALQRYFSDSKRQGELHGKPTPAEDDKKKPKAPVPPDSDTTLSEAEKNECAVWIKELDSDDFDVRQRAESKLAGLGLRAEGFIRGCLADKEKNGKPEVRAALQEVLRMIEVDTQLRSLNLAVQEAPAHFVPPDPMKLRKITETTDRLHQIASFQKSLQQTFSELSTALDVQIVFDPLIRERNEKRVDWSKSGLAAWPNGIAALENICQDSIAMSEDALSYVVRGKTVIITTTTRAHKLRLTASNLELPLVPGEKPWTREEADAFCDLFSKLYKKKGAGWRSPIEKTQVLENGDVQLEIESGHLKDVKALAENFGLADIKYAIEQTPTEAKIEALLKTPIDFEVKDTALNDIRWSDFVGSERAHLISMTIAVNRHDRANMSVKNTSVREVLLALCQKYSLYIDFYAYEDYEGLAVCSDPGYIEGYQSDFYHPVRVVNLRTALSAGAPVAELCSRLDDMAREAWHDPGVEIRGRWITRMDRFTLRRAVALVAEAARTGKVPVAPQAPWFYQTFPKRTNGGK